MESYKDFKGTKWKEMIDVNDFILQNFTEYLGDEHFLEDASDNTKQLWSKLAKQFLVEKEKGIYDAETKIPSQIDAYGAVHCW